MEIHNKLHEESFCYSEKAENITARKSELLGLFDVSEYCKKLKENIEYDMQTFFSREVEEGVSVADWLYQPGSAKDEDERQLLSRMVEQMWKCSTGEIKSPRIMCSLGEYGDANLSMRELESQLLACVPDYSHRQQLQYDFSYETEEDGKIVKKKKTVTCHPHLKLVREDSDFRIYFTWKDKDVGANEKVLVGRIGRHGY